MEYSSKLKEIKTQTRTFDLVKKRPVGDSLHVSYKKIKVCANDISLKRKTYEIRVWPLPESVGFKNSQDLFIISFLFQVPRKSEWEPLAVKTVVLK